jgi:hypothetical protein
LLGVTSVQLSEGQLGDYLDHLKAESNARTALGISAFPDKRLVELTLITPTETMERQVSFGGHPELLPRWAVNTALNWLRQAAENGQ